MSEKQIVSDISIEDEIISTLGCMSVTLYENIMHQKEAKAVEIIESWLLKAFALGKKSPRSVKLDRIECAGKPTEVKS